MGIRRKEKAVLFPKESDAHKNGWLQFETARHTTLSNYLSSGSKLLLQIVVRECNCTRGRATFSIQVGRRVLRYQPENLRIKEFFLKKNIYIYIMYIEKLTFF